MLHHVSVGVSDVGRAAAFYDAVLGALGFKRVMEFMPYAVAYGTATPSFWIQLPHDQQPASVGNGTHVGFSAKDRNAVHKFHEAAIGAGGLDNGAPGPREMYGPDYYGAFVIDLDGNRLEATVIQAVAPSKATSASPKSQRKAKKAAPRGRSLSKRAAKPRAKRRKARRS